MKYLNCCWSVWMPCAFHWNGLDWELNAVKFSWSSINTSCLDSWVLLSVFKSHILYFCVNLQVRLFKSWTVWCVISVWWKVLYLRLYVLPVVECFPLRKLLSVWYFWHYLWLWELYFWCKMTFKLFLRVWGTESSEIWIHWSIQLSFVVFSAACIMNLFSCESWDSIMLQKWILRNFCSCYCHHVIKCVVSLKLQE